MSKEDIFFGFAEDHCTIRRIYPDLYQQSKDLVVKALKSAHDTYWLWRKHFDIFDDEDFKGITDAVFAINEFLEDKAEQKHKERFTLSEILEWTGLTVYRCIEDMEMDFGDLYLVDGEGEVIVYLAWSENDYEGEDLYVIRKIKAGTMFADLVPKFDYIKKLKKGGDR